MIKISEEILTADELKEASGRDIKDIDIEITNVAVSKVNGGTSVALNIDAKLNFVMPKKTENLMKRRIAARIASAERVRFNYTYTGIMIPKNLQGMKAISPRGQTAADITAETDGSTDRTKRTSLHLQMQTANWYCLGMTLRVIRSDTVSLKAL